MAETAKISNLSANLNLHVAAEPDMISQLSQWAEDARRSVEEKLKSPSSLMIAGMSASSAEFAKQTEESARRTSSIIQTVREQEFDAATRRLNEEAALKRQKDLDNANAYLKDLREQRAAEVQLENQRTAANNRLNDHIISQRMRVMNTEDRINTEHERRVRLIMQEANLTEEQTRELIRQSEITRQMAMTKYADVIQQEKINAAAKASGQFARMGGVMQEVGRGMEDFIVGMSMGSTAADGLALGLRGSANNIAQMASYAGPMVGAFAAIGASLGAIIVPKVVEWATATDQIDKNVKQYEEWLDRTKKRAGEGVSDISSFGQMKSGEDFKKEVERRKTDVAVAEAELTAAEEAAKVSRRERQWIVAENAKKIREGIGTGSILASAAADPMSMIMRLPMLAKTWASTSSTAELEKNLKAAEDSVIKSGKDIQDKRIALERAKTHEADVLAREKAAKDEEDRKKRDKDAVKAESMSQKFLSQMMDETVRATNEKRLQYEHEYNENVAQINEMALEDKKKKEELYLQNRNLYATRMDELMAEENKKATEKVAKDQEREIDRQIFEAEQKLQSTRELMQGSQSRNTSSSALIAGTQQADAILNRAMAGSRTQEDTLKKSLDVQQKQLKELREMKRSNRLGIANIGQGA